MLKNYTAKQLSSETGYSVSYAAKLLTEIRKEYNVKRVTKSHVDAYFCVPT